MTPYHTLYSSKAMTVSHNWKMSGSSNNQLQGYMYEPKYESTEETQVLDEMSDSSDIEAEHIEPQTRVGSKEWCKCGRCEITLLVNEKEYVCCQETGSHRLATEPVEGKFSL